MPSEEVLREQLHHAMHMHRTAREFRAEFQADEKKWGAEVKRIKQMILEQAASRGEDERERSRELAAH